MTTEITKWTLDRILDAHRPRKIETAQHPDEGLSLVLWYDTTMVVIPTRYLEEPVRSTPVEDNSIFALFDEPYASGNWHEISTGSLSHLAFKFETNETPMAKVKNNRGSYCNAQWCKPVLRDKSCRQCHPSDIIRFQYNTLLSNFYTILDEDEPRGDSRSLSQESLDLIPDLRKSITHTTHDDIDPSGRLNRRVRTTADDKVNLHSLKEHRYAVDAPLNIPDVVKMSIPLSSSTINGSNYRCSEMIVYCQLQ
jgi:hypothetical protein